MLFIILSFVFIFLILKLAFGNPNVNLSEKHVMISGGSSGIGLSVAKQLVAMGAKITLLSRSENKLKMAVEDIEKYYYKHNCLRLPPGNLQYFSVDIGSSKSDISKVVQAAKDTFGNVFMLVNCAGFAKAAKFEDISEEDANAMMRVNCMGSFFLTQEIVASMKSAGKGGIVVFVSSQGGLLGIFGYTAYTASKSALIKMAEALQMEVVPYDISITVYCPPDTDTPGFVEENKTKPAETMAISASAGIYEPDEIAEMLIRDSLKGKFYGSPGLEGFLLTTLCGGMCPLKDPFIIISQILFSPLLRLISIYFQWSHSRIVLNEFKKQSSEKKNE